MKKLLTVLAIFALVLAGCDDGDKETESGNGINWNNEPNGTLVVVNNALKDVVLFQGIPSAANILGGVRASTEKTFDISKIVSDFGTGGYMTLAGITLDEYQKNESNLSAANVRYSAIVTYGQGRTFRAEISNESFGDYCFKVNNDGRTGIELHKDNPDGEKMGYVPALARNYTIYAGSADEITVYPVYVYFDNDTKNLVFWKPTSFASAVSLVPRPVTDSSISTYTFAGMEIDETAIILCTNNVPNQVAYLEVGGQNIMAQNGYSAISFGETLTFAIATADEGQEKDIKMSLYAGTVKIPVKQNGNIPVLRNGYEYTLTLNLIGGEPSNPDSYSAVINNGTKK
jgi:hypothetical protein